MTEFCLKPQYHALYQWLRGHPDWVQPPRSKETNIFDPKGSSYKIPAKEVGGLMRMQGECVAGGVPTLLMEKQAKDSCLFVDLDMEFNGPKGCVADQGGSCIEGGHLRLFSLQVGAVLASIFDLGPEFISESDAFAELGVVAVYTRKSAPKQIRPPTRTMPGCWRDGVHGYIFVRGDAPVRRYVLNQLQNVRAVEAAFGRSAQGMALANPDKCIDFNSAHVPTGLYGACKPGGQPYDFAAMHAMRFTDSLRIDPATGDMSASGNANISLTEMDPPEDRLRPWEFSLNFEMPGGAVPKLAPPLTPVAAGLIQQLREREGLDPAEARSMDEQIQELALKDSDFLYWRDMLQLINLDTMGRTEWRDVIFAISTLGGQSSAALAPADWRLLAQYFSQRAPAYYNEAGFDAMWRQATMRQRDADDDGTISWRKILYMARRDNPHRYYALRDSSHEARLRRMVFENGGELTNANIATLLHHMFRDRYVTLKSELVSLGEKVPRGGYIWMEIGHPSRQANLQFDGDLWKWNVIGSRPDSLLNAMMDQLPAMVRHVETYVRDQMDGADEDQGKNLADVLKELKRSRKALGGSGFINGALTLAATRFVDYNFSARLDADPSLLGVANGILRVKRGHVDFIHGMCDAPVSKHSAVAWADMPAGHPARVRLRKVLGDIFPDGRLDWVMKYSSMALTGGRKMHGFIVLLIGGGNNGKSVYQELMRGLFEEYGYKAPESILTGKRENSDGHNSAYAAMAGKRYIYFSEPKRRNGAVTLEVERLKEITSPEVQSTRDLCAKQVNFAIEAILMASSNNDFAVTENNYSIWKRLVRVLCQTRFVPNPDPEDPRQVLEDPSIGNEYILNPETRSAFLAELVDHYRELHAAYGGNIKHVPCTAVHNDTASYRASLDQISAFVGARVVRRADRVKAAAHENEADPGGPGRDMNLPAVVAEYKTWYAANNSGAQIRSTLSLVRELDDSIISKYQYKDEHGTTRFSGLRLLNEDDPAPVAGEAAFSLELSNPVRKGSPRGDSPAPGDLPQELPSAVPAVQPQGAGRANVHGALEVLARCSSDSESEGSGDD
jgi:phage/plasmid-associated DNA primase